MRSLLLTLFAIPAAQAAIVVEYNIPASTEAANPTSSAATVEATSLTGSGGFTLSTGTGTAYISYQNMTSTLAGALSGQDFLQFTVTIPTGTTVSFSDLNIAFRSELSAVTTHLTLFANVGGNFTTAPAESSAIGTLSTNSNATNNYQTIAINSPSLQNLTGTTVTFRLYGHDVDSTLTGNFLRIDDFTLNGTTVIPEPSLAILGAAALPLLAFRRKRII